MRRWVQFRGRLSSQTVKVLGLEQIVPTTVRGKYLAESVENMQSLTNSLTGISLLDDAGNHPIPMI